MTSRLLRFLLALSIASLTFASSALAKTWFIAADGSGDAPTIQAGVDAAAPGDTVLVGPGTYTDTHVVDGRVVNVHVTKDIVLVSRDGATVTRLAGTDIVVWAAGLGASALIQGFDIDLPRVDSWGCVGPIAATRDQLRVMPGPGAAGILVEGSTCVITGNRIRGGHYGIRVVASGATVSENDVAQCAFGISVENGDPLIVRNTVLDCAACISSYQGSPLISENTVGGDVLRPCDGIQVAVGSPQVIGNVIEKCDLDAIFCGSASATIENNRIRDGYRLYMYWAANCIVRGNILVNTELDLQLSSSTTEQNTIVGGRALLGGGTFSRNLVVGGGIACSIGVAMSCNNSWGAASNYAGTCAGAPGQNGNISVDPQFCGVPGSGNYYLQSDSPCAPGNHPDGADCGVIGALGVACGPVKTTQTRSWGAIKAIYRSN